MGSEAGHGGGQAGRGAVSGGAADAGAPRRFHGVELFGDAADEEVVARIAAEIASPGVELKTDGDRTRYRIYFPDGPPLRIARRFLDLWREHTEGDARDLAPFAEVEKDWTSVARESFPGTEVGPFWIGPTWAEAPSQRCVIRINPGRAFGTGLHASTRLALRLLLPRVSSETRVLDMGTGSGVLALAALSLGAPDVTALDIDRHALRNARENAALNGFGGRLRLVAGSLDALAAGRHAFDVVVANIEHAVLVALLSRLSSALSPDGSLLISGVTLRQRTEFLQVAHEEGLVTTGEAEEEGWWGAALAAK